MIVIDTGPEVAAANRKDDHHEQCVELLQGLPGPLLLPAPDFLRDVADGVYQLV